MINSNLPSRFIKLLRVYSFSQNSSLLRATLHLASIKNRNLIESESFIASLFSKRMKHSDHIKSRQQITLGFLRKSSQPSPPSFVTTSSHPFLFIQSGQKPQPQETFWNSKRTKSPNNKEEPEFNQKGDTSPRSGLIKTSLAMIPDTQTKQKLYLNAKKETTQPKKEPRETKSGKKGVSLIVYGSTETGFLGSSGSISVRGLGLSKIREKAEGDSFKERTRVDFCLKKRHPSLEEAGFSQVQSEKEARIIIKSRANAFSNELRKKKSLPTVVSPKNQSKPSDFFKVKEAPSPKEFKTMDLRVPVPKTMRPKTTLKKSLKGNISLKFVEIEKCSPDLIKKMDEFAQKLQSFLKKNNKTHE